MADQPMQSNPQGQMKDTAQQLTQQAQDASADVLQKTQDTARQMAQQQKGRAASSVGSVADALRQTGEHLQNSNQETFGHLAQQAADRLEELSDDLQNKSVDEMLDDVQDFARREPQLFLGGAFVLGLFAARFLKSSSPRRPMYGQGGYMQGEYGSQYGTRYGSRSGSQYRQRRNVYPEGDFGTVETGADDDYGTGEGGYQRRYSSRYGQSGYGPTESGQFTGSDYTAGRPASEPRRTEDDVPPYPGQTGETGE